MNPEPLIKNSTAGPDSTRASRIISVERMESVDVMRACIMVIMIFVNDLWSLREIPSWLGHAGRGEDRIGLADLVFPAFLFIVGLSIPFSMEARRASGDSPFMLGRHIVLRSAALIIMGVFLVNAEEINKAETGMPRSLFFVLCCTGFLMIWCKVQSRTLLFVRLVGIALLITLAVVYRGGNTGEPERFEIRWWGILGLIGWTYLVSAFIFVVSKGNLFILIASWLTFAGLSILSNAGLASASWHFVPAPVRDGTLTAMTLGGVVISVLTQRFKKRNEIILMTAVFISIAIVLFVLYSETRVHWGLSKLDATPAWLFLSSAIALLFFLFVFVLVDGYKKGSWFTSIKTAGTATLLCYLTPYLLYSLMSASRLSLPDVLNTGNVGLLKSFVFALLCVVATRLLSKAGVKLQL
jgi:heparan-alpha-glucosaminide N-acetyltransferase